MQALVSFLFFFFVPLLTLELNLALYQFEASDDPLDKITTAEAIRTLIDYYRTSQHSYAAIQKVDETSKVVSSLFCD